jgi:hypothetical protein
MDSRTLELFRCLQSGPFDEAGLKQIQRLLGSQRRALAAKSDLATLGEIIQLLEGWAIAAGNGKLSAAALGEAAEIAERDLRQVVLANELRARAVHAGRRTADPTIEVPHVEATAEELTAAIERAESALDADAAPTNVRALADLYARRGAEGDREQAADLYFTLADVLGNPGGIELLQLALWQMPDHAEARALLASYTGRASEPAAQRRTSQTAVEAAKPLANAVAAGLVSPPPLGAARAALGGDVPRTSPRISAPRLSTTGLSAVGSAPPALGGGASRPPNLPVSSLSPVVLPESASIDEPPTNPRRRWGWAVVGMGACAVAAGFFLGRPALQPSSAPDQTTHSLARGPETPGIASAAPENAQPQEPSAAPAQAAGAQPENKAAARDSQPMAAEAAAPAQVAGEAPEVAKPKTEPELEPAKIAEKAAPAHKVAALMDQLTQRGGNLNPQLLAAAFEKLQPQLAQCYGDALQKKPKLKGKLVLGFTVQKNGHATAFKHMGGNIKEPGLIQCSVKAMEAARFPKPRKFSASVKLPFQFQPS